MRLYTEKLFRIGGPALEKGGEREEIQSQGGIRGMCEGRVVAELSPKAKAMALPPLLDGVGHHAMPQSHRE